MNNSLNIRLVIPYMKVSYHIPHQCRYLNTRTGSLSIATSSVSSQGLGLGLLRPNSKRLSLMIGIGSHKHNHFLSVGLCPYAGHFRLGIAHCPYSEPFVKSFRMGSGNVSETGKLPQDSRSGDAEVPADPISENFIAKYAELDASSITNGDPVLQRKLDILILEVDVWRQEGKSIPTPSLIKTASWKELLNANTRSARLKILNFLFVTEKKKLQLKAKKDAKRELFLSRREENEDNSEDNPNRLHRNSMFMRIYETTMNHHYNSKLIQAMQFGQKIVIDCSYEAHMSSAEAKNLASQIKLSFANNRVHEDPFDIYLCNAKPDSKTLKQLQSLIATLYEDHFPLNVTNKSYLELFPKEDIVYLTPHCREVLKSYDPDAVYIIGGIVDKSNQEPLSLGKAKQEGLKMAKLPLDHYLVWAAGQKKTLTINQMVDIMLRLKTTGDWQKAFECVPKRKHLTNDELRSENRVVRRR